MPDLQLCDGAGGPEGLHCCSVPNSMDPMDGSHDCPHLVIDGPTGRRYACGLYTELGDWALVHADPRYLAEPGAMWDQRGVDHCGDWMGARRETAVAIRARGGFTAAEFEATALCCFRRRWCDTPQKVAQAVRALNRRS